MTLRLSPLSHAVSALAGGLRQFRAPGRTAADELADHPIAETARFWKFGPVTPAKRGGVYTTSEDFTGSKPPYRDIPARGQSRTIILPSGV